MRELGVAAILIISYLVGAIPFAVLVARAVSGVDVQQAGSGNAGTRNTLLTAGKKAGLLVALLDGGKGALALGLGRLAFGPQVAVFCGAAAIVGHCFSPYLVARWWGQPAAGWKLALRRVGGKGLATGIAVILLVCWPAGLICIGLFLLLLPLARMDETWPAIIAVAMAVPLTWWWTSSWPTTLAILIVALVIIVKHLPDVRQGFSVDGQER